MSLAITLIIVFPHIEITLLRMFHVYSYNDFIIIFHISIDFYANI